MSAPVPNVYRFSTAAQWNSCLLHRFDVTKEQTLAPVPRLAANASQVGEFDAISTVALGPAGALHGRVETSGAPPRLIRLVGDDDASRPFEIEGALAAGRRWVVDREWIWTFAPDGSVVTRYERDTLQLDLELDVRLTVRDITADGRQGVWLLLETADGAVQLLHVDCKGCRRQCYPVPCEASGPTRLGSVLNGAQLALVVGNGRRLIFLDAASGALDHTQAIGTLAPCWSAKELATDTKERIALWGEQTFDRQPAQGMAFVLDGGGDTVDGPLSAPASVTAIAVRRDALWFAADTGLWRIGVGNDQDARESDSTVLTPALLSPDSDPTRGWLRAEVCADLPRGAVLDAEFATTDKEDIAAQAGLIAADKSTTSEQKQESIWQLLEHPAQRRFRFTAPFSAGQPIAIPLFESRDRWLWLRLKFLTPPGTTPAHLEELRILYPDLSIARYLPAAFRGERKDPTGLMRRLVGVLETTTQGLDDRIRRIGMYIDPGTAPPGWFDYLGRWLDLPWDDELDDSVKQRLLGNAGALLDARATRKGLRLLLKCLVGGAAAVRIVDLTVDHGAAVLGGSGVLGPALPALLGGSSPQTPTLGERAVVGRARLCPASDPFDVIAPAVHIEIVTPESTPKIAGLLPRILAQYLPAGVATKINWLTSSGFESAMSDGDHVVLDEEGPGRLGRDSAIGRTVLAGRRGRLTGCGLGIDLRLR